MRKLPSAWSIIRTDNACWAVTTSAPVVFFIALTIKLTGTIPGRRGGPDTPVDPEVANMVLVDKASSALLRSSRTPAFSEGTRIPVLVHPANPKCAIPLALYADPGPAHSDERPISPENQSWVLKLKAPGREHRSGASQTVPREDR